MSNLLIVGIGNPGDEYKDNRHNFGFKAVDFLSDKLGIHFEFDKKKSIFGIKKIDKEKSIILLKPQTFANLSGEAVLYLASFLKVDLKNILVIFDNPYLDLGVINHIDGSKDDTKIKLIKNGAIQNLIDSLNSCFFSVIELGIGPINDGLEIEEFCLQDFTNKEMNQFGTIFNKIDDKIEEFIKTP